uniref:AlNc14C417G11493 protein n=1 Tax=Albugo laibachii Nc14 TaxID=890382 RepID=F0WZ87_9STRA|nr:AlNc14C417G11493 [Albugo laibachii Nc14]|eukprot:CCA26804.1 AlNc14C417G11493 [Albugo laibachii Nc14]
MKKSIHLSSQIFEIEPESIYFLIDSEYISETCSTRFDPSGHIRFVCLDGELQLLTQANNKVSCNLPPWPCIQHFCEWMDKILKSDSNQMNDQSTHSVICIYMTKDFEQKQASESLVSDFALHKPHIRIQVIAVYLMCCWQIRSRKQSVQEAWNTYELYHKFRSIYPPFSYIGFPWWLDDDKDIAKPREVDPALGTMVMNMFLEGDDMRCKTSTTEFVSWDDVFVSLCSFARMHATYQISESFCSPVVTSNNGIVRLTVTLSLAIVTSNDLKHLASLHTSLKATIVRVESDTYSTPSDSNFGLKTINVKLSELEADSEDKPLKVFSSRKETKTWKVLSQFLHICETQNGSIILLSSLPDVPLWICGYLIKHEQLSAQEASSWLRSCTSGHFACSSQHLFFLKRWRVRLTQAGDECRRKVQEKRVNVAATSRMNDGNSSKLCKQYRRISMGRVNLSADALLGIRTGQQNDSMMASASLGVSHPVHAALSPSTRAAQSNKHRQMINVSRLQKDQDIDRDPVIRSDYGAIRRYLNPTSK